MALSPAKTAAGVRGRTQRTSGLTRKTPFGLAFLVAMAARRMFGPMPTDALQRVASRIWQRSVLASASGSLQQETST